MQLSEEWTEFVDTLQKLEFDPFDWLDLFKSFLEYKIQPVDFIDPRRAAKKMSSLMIMELTKQAISARSEQVRHAAAKELAHIGGAQPTKPTDDDFVNLPEKQLDALIDGYMEDESEVKRRSDSRAKKRSGKASSSKKKTTRRTKN